MSRGKPSCERGSITPLIIGIAMIGVLLLGVLTDSARAFLAQRALVRLADSSALAAASSLDAAAYYAGRSPRWMPIDDGRARQVARDWIDKAASKNDGLRNLRMISLVVDGGGVRLTLAAQVRVGFLDSIFRRSVLSLSATASAASRRS